MARMKCICGEYLSNTAAPNDIQLRIYFGAEWNKILKIEKYNGWNFSLPQYDIWICPTCKRIYVFGEGYGPAKKVYKRIEIVNERLNILEYNI